MSARDKINRRIKQADNLTKVLQASKAMQTRFVLIPPKSLNSVTVAGIRDMNLGRIGKDGKPVGGNVIQFKNPAKQGASDFPRITIDPKGVPNKANPHIPVSPGVIKGVEVTQNVLQVTGKALFVVSVIASGIRIGKAVYDVVTIDDEIRALEGIICCLEEDLKDGHFTEPKRTETQEALNYAKELLDKAEDSKNKPGTKILTTICCVGGEWGGAAAGGNTGAEAGALLGAPGGPVGAFAGAVTGSVVGAIVGSELGQTAVENFELDDDHISTALCGSLVDIGKGKDIHGEVLGLNGNVAFGDLGDRSGLQLGGGMALFDIKNESNGEKISVLKGGSNLNITTRGVDVGVESKILRAEGETDRVKYGVGLNLDTGFKIADDGVKMEVLGFGFSAGDDGWGVKLPFFDLKFKK